MRNLQQYNMLLPNCSVRKWIYQQDFMPVITSNNVWHMIKTLTIASSIEKNMNEANPNSMNSSNLQTDNLATQADLQSQVVELQMNMSHLELTVERLDEVITRQDKHIQTLQRQLQFIYKQVESQDGEGGVAPFDVMADRPPHY